MKRHEPWIAAGLCLVMGFAFGRLSKLSNPELVAALGKARTESALAQASSEAQQATNQVLRQQLAASIEKHQRLAEDLDRLNQALSPQDALVKVQSLHMVPEGQGAWRYELELMGIGGRDLKGKLGLLLSGTLNGLPFSLDLVEAAQGDNGKKGTDWQDFTLRNLDTLSGRFWLPDGFVPQTLDLRLKVKGMSESLRHYPWAELAQEPGTGG
ncbi:hypothetical protein PVT67_03460 [Gallaecimonas kandeliae]|uniref:DUF6776 family protein n=1 Tax=Gallaecimonas kandeliae TaxID=3029055 RepID=UPI002647CDE1|nr:DUF6776 family protein [Gallaecimonas kandeliae]WKE66321.1 hypothetical protein PVT67_03460 [Gallaecimonas kandeliae]